MRGSFVNETALDYPRVAHAVANCSKNDRGSHLECRPSVWLARLRLLGRARCRPLRAVRRLRPVPAVDLPSQGRHPTARGALGPFTQTGGGPRPKRVTRLHTLRRQAARPANGPGPAFGLPCRRPPCPVAGAMGSKTRNPGAARRRDQHHRWPALVRARATVLRWLGLYG